jgi:hypothetical protein
VKPLRIAVPTAIAAAAILVGCGGGSGTQPQVDVGPNVGQPISLADCNNGSSPSGTGAVLDDKQAYDLFNRYCASSFARGFKLYKLYERAAAFAGHPAQ